MNKFIVKLLFVSLILINNAYVFARDPEDIYIDLDFDGKPDRITIYYPYGIPEYGDENQTVLVGIRVYPSTENKHFDFVLPVELTLFYYLHPYPWNNNYLLLYLTNTLSRDARSLNYQIYRWDTQEKKLCLYVDVTGVAANQLKNEEYPSFKQVKVFNKCLNMSDSSPSEDMSNDYWKINTNITANITEEKAWLYDSPGSSKKTKMYLVKNNQVVIKDYTFSQEDGVDWFLVEYYNDARKKTIIKWVKGKSIGLILSD